MDDDELEAIRAKRMAQLQQQYGVGSFSSLHSYNIDMS